MNPNYNAILFGQDPIQNEILSKTLDRIIDVKHYSEEQEFEANAEPADSSPDIFIIHKSLKNGDGIIACENIRNITKYNNTSILMILDSESVYQKIKCYEAGADDYIIQPYHPEEIIRKVKRLSNASSEKRDLDSQSKKATFQAKDATKTAFEAMRASSDLGLVIKFMESCQSSNTYESLVDKLCLVTLNLGITAIIQIHAEDGDHTFSQRGDVKPIEVQLLHEARHKGRIVEEKNFIIVNFDLISLMIEDMPADELKYGRLKDTLAQLVGSAEIRVRSIMVNEILHAQSRETISVINLIRQIASDNHKHSTMIMKRLSEQIEMSAVTLALTEEQEDHFVDLAEKAHIELETLYRGSEVLESHFMRVILGLQKAIDMQEGKNPST